MKNRLYYLAHPVAPDEEHSYEFNIADGKDWWRALLRAGYKVDAPWVGLCYTLDDFDPGNRDMGMEIDTMVLGRLDGVIFTGHRLSSGMIEEWNVAMEKGIPIFNLVGKSIEDGIKLLDILMENSSF